MVTIAAAGAKIDRTIGLPAYQRIEQDVRNQIASGAWPLGSTLPSRRELARRYGVQLQTLQSAIGPLLADGTLAATARQGTVVAKAPSAGLTAQLASGRAGNASTAIITGTVGIIALVSYGPNERIDGRNYNGNIVDAVEKELASDGVSSVFFGLAKYSNDYVASINDASSQGVDAVVVVMTHDANTTIGSAIDRVSEAGLPAVFVTAEPISEPYSSICYDQISAGYRAAQHLILSEARRIIFVAPYSDKWLRDRVEGARNAVLRTGFEPSAFTVFPGEPETDSRSVIQETVAEDLTRRLIASGDLCGSAIISCNDHAATVLVRIACEFGLRSGIDYQIVSFDDTIDAREIGITSLRPPSAEMGAEAARLILRRMRGDRATLTVSLQSHLVTRSSSRPLRILPVTDGIELVAAV